MSAMYFLPQNDITTQELAIITGFVTIGLVNNIEQRKEELLQMCLRQSQMELPKV